MLCILLERRRSAISFELSSAGVVDTHGDGFTTAPGVGVTSVALLGVGTGRVSVLVTFTGGGAIGTQLFGRALALAAGGGYTNVDLAAVGTVFSVLITTDALITGRDDGAGALAFFGVSTPSKASSRFTEGLGEGVVEHAGALASSTDPSVVARDKTVGGVTDLSTCMYA